MPSKPARACKYPRCPALTFNTSGYCDAHKQLSWAGRPRRTYADRHWRALRIRVLREHGIPACDWPKWDVHHTPQYDPAKDPVHEHYTLTPMLREEHARLTAQRGG